MQYSKSVYLKAAQTLEKRRTAAEADALARRNELYGKIPELREIDYRISGIYASPEFLVKGVLDTAKLSELTAEKEEILRKCGYEKDCLLPRYTCPECGDTGRAGGFLCHCQKELLRALAMEELFESSEAEKCSFENFSLGFYDDTGISDSTNPRYKMGLIFDFCRKYAEGFSDGSESIIMAGKTGLGKTHLSLAIARKAVEAGAGVVYRPAQKLTNEMESEHFERSGNNASETFSGCDLLIIDDLGAEFSNQFTVAAIGNIVNDRLVAGLPTIISTNLTPSELEARYTERTASRIFGNYRRLGFVGSDIRMKKKGNME